MEQQVKEPIEWKDAKEYVHPTLWEDEWGNEKWSQVQAICDAEIGWRYDGTCYLKDCDTWRSLVDCLAKHKECEWDESWECDWEYQLNYDPYLSE